MDIGILNISLKTLLIFFASLTVTLFILPRLIVIAPKVGLLDYPNSRKLHDSPKPLIGGLAIIIALFISCLLFIPLTNLKGFYAGLNILVINGILDDRRKWNTNLNL